MLVRLMEFMRARCRGQFLLGSVLALLGLAAPALAGPPFQTDDPQPVDFHHYEAYAFGTFDHTHGGTGAQFPAFEFNVGAAPNLQLHLVVPMAYAAADGQSTQYGVGDMELGMKYRFVNESAHGWLLMVGVFPMVEVPSGDAARGLGNGSTWARLPLWIQKDIGTWTTYGGAGYTINRAPGMRDYPFAGWLVQRTLNKKWTLGGELFGQGAQEVDGRGSTYFDAGGYYSFTPGFQLLFMGGHTVAGEPHTIGYLGLYWTWGREKK